MYNNISPITVSAGTTSLNYWGTTPEKLLAMFEDLFDFDNQVQESFLERQISRFQEIQAIYSGRMAKDVEIKMVLTSLFFEAAKKIIGVSYDNADTFNHLSKGYVQFLRNQINAETFKQFLLKVQAEEVAKAKKFREETCIKRQEVYDFVEATKKGMQGSFSGCPQALIDLFYHYTNFRKNRCSSSEFNQFLQAPPNLQIKNGQSVNEMNIPSCIAISSNQADRQNKKPKNHKEATSSPQPEKMIPFTLEIWNNFSLEKKHLDANYHSLSPIQMAMDKFQLGPFPDKVINAANAFSEELSPSDIADRADLRSDAVITIDPAEAGVLEDALSLTKDTSKGTYCLSVHITDVAHYVKSNGLLDEEAKKRANYVHLRNRDFPMLPQELSKRICSLLPGKKRLAITVNLSFDQDGSLLQYRIFRSIIKNQRRFTSEQVNGILNGAVESEYKILLQEMQELALLLNKKRTDSRKAGDLEFSSHLIVPEFMQKVNEVAASHLLKQGIVFPQRVQLSTDSSQQVSSKAFYSIENIGHASLQLSAYCRFTCPARRYLDLLIQRALVNEHMDAEQLQQIVLHASNQERISEEAAAFIQKDEKLSNLCSEPFESQDYDAIVTKVSPSGFTFKVCKFAIDIFFDNAKLPYFEYDEHQRCFLGSTGRVKILPGTAIKVNIVDVDRTTQTIAWKAIKIDM